MFSATITKPELCINPKPELDVRFPVAKKLSILLSNVPLDLTATNIDAAFNSYVVSLALFRMFSCRNDNQFSMRSLSIFWYRWPPSRISCIITPSAPSIYN